jgi:hypothetical protein
MVLAKDLNSRSIVEAFKRGDFYATCGVLLNEVAFDGRTFNVDVKTEPGVSYKVQFIGTRKNAPTEGKPTDDPAARPTPAPTMQYGAAIGEVFLETSQNPAVYSITGDEMYIRAKIVSDKKQPNPHAEGDVETAWTQPVVID